MHALIRAQLEGSSSASAAASADAGGAERDGEALADVAARTRTYPLLPPSPTSDAATGSSDSAGVATLASAPASAATVHGCASSASRQLSRGTRQIAMYVSISSPPAFVVVVGARPRASSSFPLPIALAHTHPHSPNLFLNLSQLPQGVRRRGERGRRQVGVDPRQIKVEGDAEARAGTRAAAWLASDAAPPREEARACAEAERNEAAHEARRLGRGLPRSRDEDVVALVSRESSLTALARVLLF